MEYCTCKFALNVQLQSRDFYFFTGTMNLGWDHMSNNIFLWISLLSNNIEFIELTHTILKYVKSSHHFLKIFYPLSTPNLCEMSRRKLNILTWSVDLPIMMDAFILRYYIVKMFKKFRRPGIYIHRFLLLPHCSGFESFILKWFYQSCPYWLDRAAHFSTNHIVFVNLINNAT